MKSFAAAKSANIKGEESEAVKHLTTPQASPVPLPSARLNTESVDSPTLELLASWRKQDKTSNPEELIASEDELASFKKSMNENRARVGAPPLYP